MNASKEPINVFKTSLIRPKDVVGNPSIRISPSSNITLDGCENIEHLEIESEKVAQKLNILGPFPEHLVIDGKFKRLKLGGTMNIRDWEPFVGNWTNGLICNRLKPIDRTPDIMIMAFPRSDNGILRIGPEYCGNTLAIRGSSTIKKIIIEPEKQMNHIVIQSMEWLEEIVLNGRVTQLQISNTPRLKKISGYGHYLSVKTNSFANMPPLDINGFWLNLDTTLHECRQESFILNDHLLENCEDLQGRIVHTSDYNVACKWAELFNIEIEEAVLGISLNGLIELWKENENDGQMIFDEWLDDERFQLDKKYFGMRIAMALLLCGQKKKAIRARNIALTGIASNRIVAMKLRPLVFSYRRDMDVFAPYDLLDLEFLSRAFMDEEMPAIFGKLSDSMNGLKSSLEWMLLIDSKRDLDFAPVVLELCSDLIENLRRGSQIRNLPFTSHYSYDLAIIIQSLERLDTKNYHKDLIIQMAEIIEDSSIPAIQKAGLIIGLMQIEDRPDLRIYLSRLSSSLDRASYRIVHVFRISGCKTALQKLGIKRFNYPYQLNNLR